jgi:hypothetical protein
MSERTESPDAMTRLGYKALLGTNAVAPPRPERKGRTDAVNADEPSTDEPNVDEPRGAERDGAERDGAERGAEEPLVVLEARRQVSVYVPGEVAEALYRYQANLPAEHRLALGEIVLGVLAEVEDELRGECVRPEQPTTRFGAPLRTRFAARRSQVAHGEQLRIHVPVSALKAIDELASELGMTRSRLISEACERAIQRGVLG